MAPTIYIFFLLTVYTDVDEFLPNIRQEQLSLYYVVNIMNADVLVTQGATCLIQYSKIMSMGRNIQAGALLQNQNHLVSERQFHIHIHKYLYIDAPTHPICIYIYNLYYRQIPM